MRSTPTLGLGTPSEYLPGSEPRTTPASESAGTCNRQALASPASREGSTPSTPSRQPGTPQTWLQTSSATLSATRRSSLGSLSGIFQGWNLSSPPRALQLTQLRCCTRLLSDPALATPSTAPHTRLARTARLPCRPL